MPGPRSQNHLIKEGESLSTIAETHYGDPSVWPQIARANRIPRHGQIVVGMKLKLPALRHLPQHGRPLRTFGAVRPAMMRTPPPSGSAAPFARYLNFPWIHFNFEKGISISPGGTSADVTVTLKGDIAIRKAVGNPTSAEVNFAFDHNGRPSLELTQDYKTQFGQFTADTTLKFNASNATLEGGFAISKKLGPIDFSADVFPPSLTATLDPPAPVEGYSEDKKWMFKGTLTFEVKIEDNPPDKVYPFPQPYAVTSYAYVQLKPSSGLLSDLLRILRDLIDATAIIITATYGVAQYISSNAGPVVTVAAIARSQPLEYSSAAALYNWPQHRL